MKKVHLNIPITNIEDEVMKDQEGRNIMVKGAIANIILQGSSDDPIRMSDLARKIYKSGSKGIEIEDGDFKQLSKLIKEARVSNMFKEKIYIALEIKE